jgi:hypothetical protein
MPTKKISKLIAMICALLAGASAFAQIASDDDIILGSLNVILAKIMSDKKTPDIPPGVVVEPDPTKGNSVPQRFLTYPIRPSPIPPGQSAPSVPVQGI